MQKPTMSIYHKIMIITRHVFFSPDFLLMSQRAAEVCYILPPAMLAKARRPSFLVASGLRNKRSAETAQGRT